MPLSDVRWTPARVRTLADGRRRFECVDGALLVTPAPSRRHQRVLRELLLRLGQHLASDATFEVLPSPSDWEFDGGTLLQPDLFVSRLGVPVLATGWPEATALQLVVEVLSPSTAQRDRGVKRRKYLSAGVPEVWLVDPLAERVERWRPGQERPEFITQALQWEPVPGGRSLVLALPELFGHSAE
ncbi:MAG: Uma2 family endonuclease [Gemmatimonadales bacterium]|nr:Uma2 family endonuclease [Gemmatimonadales bacterium]